MKAATYASAGNLQLLDQASPPFKLSEVEKAYDVFKHAGENHALKVISKMISVNEVATVFVHSF